MVSRPHRRRRSSIGEPEQLLYLDHPTEPGRKITLGGAEAGHARKSLRLRTGDAVVLVDGRGCRYPGHITDLTKTEVTVRVDAAEPVPTWPRRTIWMGAGILRSTRMDTLIEKASELGVTRLVPLLLRRSVARPHEEGSKQVRWHRLAVESLKQSRRSHLMAVEDPRSLGAFLEGVPAGASLWVADPRGRSPLEAAREALSEPLVLVVGAEGGLAPDERDLLLARGGIPVGLGGNRLRAETAALALVTGALASLGEMGTPPRGD
jgi:16S rRNA (uracil1498-N3)-methyltransferase